MDGDQIFTLLFLLLLLAIFVYQIFSIFKIEVYEYKSTALRLVHSLGAVFLLIFSAYFGSTILHYIISVVLFFVFLINPYTTGLAEEKIYYEPNIGGLARLSSKTQKYTNIRDFTINKEGDILEVEMVFKNKLKLNMHFDHDFEDQVFRKMYL